MSRKRIPIVPAPPENPGVEIAYRVMESFKRMSKEEFFAHLVDTGIYTPDGRLTKKYGGTADPEEAEAA